MYPIFTALGVLILSLRPRNIESNILAQVRVHVLPLSPRPPQLRRVIYMYEAKHVAMQNFKRPPRSTRHLLG